MKHLTLTLFLGLVLMGTSLNVQADDEKKLFRSWLQKGDGEKYQQPDVPGILYISVGWSFFNDRPQTFQNNIWGSRAFQAYYLYDYPLGKSKTSLRVGFGVSSTKFKFTTADVPGLTNTLFINEDNETIVAPLVTDPRFERISNLRKSQFEVVFLDIPVEIVLNSKREKERSGLYFALGVRGGLRIDSQTKVVYWQDGQRRKTKQKSRFNFNNTRFSVGARVGTGNVSVFYWWTVSKLFKSEEGPEGTEDMNYMTFGLSLSIL